MVSPRSLVPSSVADVYDRRLPMAAAQQMLAQQQAGPEVPFLWPQDAKEWEQTLVDAINELGDRWQEWWTEIYANKIEAYYKTLGKPGESDDDFFESFAIHDTPDNPLYTVDPWTGFHTPNAFLDGLYACCGWQADQDVRRYARLQVERGMAAPRSSPFAVSSPAGSPGGSTPPQSLSSRLQAMIAA